MAYHTLQYCNLDGQRIAYHREGSGDVLLFLHGITTYSFIWRNIAPGLSDSFDVIAVDLLGNGDSDKPLDISYSLKQHSILICKFAEKLGIGRLHLVCHDVGGGIGQILAVDYPDLLISLILVNSVAFDFWPVQPIIAMRTPIVRQLAMATLDLGVFKVIIKRGLYHKERVTSELLDFFFRPMRKSEGRKAFLHFARSLDNRNLLEISDSLELLKLPVLIIRGDEDFYLSEMIAMKLHDVIPGSQLVHIPAGGHFIQEDEPEEIIRLIKDFTGTCTVG